MKKATYKEHIELYPLFKKGWVDNMNIHVFAHERSPGNITPMTPCVRNLVAGYGVKEEDFPLCVL